MIKYCLKKNEIDIEISYYTNLPLTDEKSNEAENSLNLTLRDSKKKNSLQITANSKQELGHILQCFSAIHLNINGCLSKLQSRKDARWILGEVYGNGRCLDGRDLSQNGEIIFWKDLFNTFDAKNVWEAIRETGLHELLPEK